MSAKINILLKNRPARPITLSLPAQYQSEQWLSEVCDTLADAEEVISTSFHFDCSGND